MTNPMTSLFKPTYIVDVISPSLNIIVRVRAHEMFANLQLNGVPHVVLEPEQYLPFVKWLRGEGMIQDLLPGLSVSDREILMSGLDDQSFAAATGGDDDGEA